MSLAICTSECRLRNKFCLLLPQEKGNAQSAIPQYHLLQGALENASGSKIPLKNSKNFQHFVSLVDNSAVLTGKYEKSMEILNENADLTEAEFEALYKGCDFGNVKLSDLYDDGSHMYKFPTDLTYDLDKIPDFVDWTEKGAITPV